MKRIENTGRILFVILLSAFLVRLAGINYDTLFSVDELRMVKMAFYMGKILAGIEPGEFAFNYPQGHLTLLCGVYGIYFIAGKLMGFLSSHRDILLMYYTSQIELFVIGRYLSLAAGVAVVWIVFRLCKKMFDVRTAVLGALLAAFLPDLADYSRIIKADIISAAFFIGSAYFIKSALDKPDYKYFFWGCLLSGASAAVKYYGGVMLPFFLAVPFFRIKLLPGKKAVKIALVSLLA
ncbi:MAG: glycosyltransferase family 39 protein, partial [bacterium]|nr:glycosyltransferase family 39 protein [bacterium]